MDSMTGIVIIFSLSLFAAMSLALLYYADKFSARRAAQQEMLLQRIQAPQIAVDQHVIREAHATPTRAVRFDDDEDFYRLKDDDMLGVDMSSLGGTE